ncbi:A disintegrin and metalloproteinase with thrombospondin motifs 7 isoform X1 [Alosa sapidissima]|uniref:A disintegrin and metalloproteinase with thrombospondin motifs 7 isoform X1 n=2 Tax=Alosa sapidissima TaxID=34773 RepID=UPI001C081415|nr:A disintegrin and metalloproteinase with thrombospondin motifs 7 isoform X1 [Alosa sapidissima]
MMLYVYCGVHTLLRATSFHLLITAGVLVMLENMTYGIVQGTDAPQGLPPYEVVHPLRVDSRGHFISSAVSFHVSRIQRRETQEAGRLAQVFYQLQYGGRNLHFNLSLNPHLVAPGFVTEKRYGGLQGSKVHRPRHSLCHFIGKVLEGSAAKGQAALSTCDGLTGLFKLAEDEFFIRPLERADGEQAPQAHVIYQRQASQVEDEQLPPLTGGPALNGSCGFNGETPDPSRGLQRWERQRERWEHRQHRRRIHERSISREKWVETLVVADPKMVEYHGSKGVENYILAVMNIVAGLFRDASIGNAINIAVVRIILLEKDEEDLKITHHADHSLNSFCKWQKRLNMKGDGHPVHHDVAILLTRKDICASINKPCETLGLSHVAGMCQPHRSCSISEDTGLPVAFTVAHELGHNFGIQHDGSGNDCEPIGKRPFIMSPQLLYGAFAPSWSRCSRQYITRFLDRGWGWCLDDSPGRDELLQHGLLPGALYSATHQCQLQYGSGSLLCDEVDNVCSTLWCTVGNTCHSKLDGAVDGTKCGEGKWCFGGECVPVGDQPEPVNGGWEPWSEWSDCSRTCGAGVQSAQRDCTNPAPRHGGRYCLGERRRYKICNTDPCPPDQLSFRHIQCSNFNTMPYKGKFYQWVHVNNRVNPCELHCRPLNEYFSEKLLDAVTDGTQCYEDSESRDMCINGICKNVGCDFEIDSNAVEDRCGVCQGNGSTCETVKKTFEESEGLGYVDIGLIPAGARDIRIEEVAEAGNFLALRSSDPKKYFLNGGWTIQWNGDYKAAGTVFTYERTGHLENLTSPGPTLEPVWIQLLFQETNPGVRYEYTISRNSVSNSNGTHPLSDFQWQFGSWTECSATCGTGVQRQIVHCVERTTGMVEDHYCDPSSRPDDKRASCNEEICPAIWWVGEWHRCSASCGESGLAKRTVLCIQSVGLEEQRALQPSACQRLERPQAVAPCNTHIPCPATWTAGNWSECSTTCAGGLQTREVACSWDTGVDCESAERPDSVTSCFIQDCPSNADAFGGDWSGSGSSSKEVFNDINAIPDDNHLPTFDTGSTKAQPRGHGNPNNHIEEDFLYSNYIDKTSDKSIKSNLPVDDFYYDYNFINFHEDLSSDVDTDSEGKKVLDNSGTQEPTPGATTAGTVQNKVITNASQTTSTILISNSEDFFSTTTISPDVNDEDGKIMSEGSENEERILTENPDVSDDDLFLMSEDHFLPISVVTPLPKSITKFSHPWRESMKEIGTIENPEDLPITTRIPAFQYIDLMKETQSPVQVNNVDPPIGNNSTGSSYEDGYPDIAGDYHDETGLADTEVIPPTTDSYDEGVSPEYGIYEEREKGYEDEDVPGGDSWTQSQETTAAPQRPSEGLVLKVESLVPTTTSPVWSETTQVPLTTPFALDLDVNTQLHLEEKSTFTTADGLKSSYSWTTQPDDLDATHDVSQEPLLTSLEPSPMTQHYQDTTSGPGTASLPPTDANPPSQTPQTTTASWDYDNDYEPWLTTTVTEGVTSSPVLDASPFSETDIPSSLKSLGEVDYNEILVPPSMRFRGTDSPTESPTSSPQRIHVQATTAPQRPAASPPMPSEASQTQPTSAAQWRIGNWSSCSTSCGLGAVWRIVICSSGVDSDCDQRSKPAPAHRCYLRPCSAWRVSEWSKCSRNCGGGERLRDVQCYDMRDQRALRPFHCQAVSTRPPSHVVCNVQPCLEWYTSSWGQCSEQCGGGDQQRLVTCPEPGRCDESLMPNSIQACNSQSCAQWVTGSWGQCSASCGGGVQRRLVKCVNTKSEQEQEAEAQCDHEPTPENTQKCNPQECDTASTAQVCVRDRLTFRFCQTLQWLGRCHLATVRAQCCKTCAQWARARDGTTHR